MKKLFVLLYLFSCFAYANHICWQGNYDDALQKAKKQDKALMVLLIKNDCQKCKDLVSKVFTNQTYIDKLNKKVVAVIVNKDNKHSYPIEMFWSNHYPTLFFVDSKNETFIEAPIYKLITKKEIQKIIDDLFK